MKKYKIIDLEDNKEYELKEIDLDNKKFVVKIDVKNMSPNDVPVYMERIRKVFEEWAGSKAKFLFVPFREPEDFKIYEVKVE